MYTAGTASAPVARLELYKNAKLAKADGSGTPLRTEPLAAGATMAVPEDGAEKKATALVLAAPPSSLVEPEPEPEAAAVAAGLRLRIGNRELEAFQAAITAAVQSSAAAAAAAW